MTALAGIASGIGEASCASIDSAIAVGLAVPGIISATQIAHHCIQVEMSKNNIPQKLKNEYRKRTLARVVSAGTVSLAAGGIAAGAPLLILPAIGAVAYKWYKKSLFDSAYIQE